MMKALTPILAITLSAPHLAHAEPVTLADFLALPRPAPSATVAYGPAPSQAIDLFLPQGAGPHPVAILIHGGCWKNIPGAGREQLRPIGRELADRGIAVWSLGYRRADEAGGGYPGTFHDVGTAVDRLRVEASRYQLDLSRTVLVGHSAGGHLALWLAARDRLPAHSALKSAAPFMPRSAIGLAGIGDLKAFAPFAALLCGPDIVERLKTPPPADPYADTSPAAMPPPGVEVLLVSGVLDRLVPPYVAHDYAAEMQRKYGTRIERLNIAEAGHFDLVMRGTAAWEQIRARIVAALEMSRDPPIAGGR